MAPLREPGTRPSALETFAVIGGRPTASSTGKVMRVPEPTMVLMVPAPMPAAKTASASQNVTLYPSMTSVDDTDHARGSVLVEAGGLAAGGGELTTVPAGAVGRGTGQVDDAAESLERVVELAGDDPELVGVSLGDL